MGLFMRRAVGVSITAALSCVGLTAISTPAYATTMQSTVLPPVNGFVTSTPDEQPPHHKPYGGNYSFDIATTGAVLARFRNSSGSLALTVATIRRACASQIFAHGGDRITLNVLINGSKVGTVTYAHMTRFPYGEGAAVPVGARIGDIVTAADGVTGDPEHKCWSGPHVHVEPRNDAQAGCFFGGLFHSQVTENNPLGIVGGEWASGPDQRCAGEVENPPRPPFGNYEAADSPSTETVHVVGWAIDPNAMTSPVTVHLYIGGHAGDPNAEGHDLGPADVHRADVGAAFPGAGDFHGFDEEVTTGRTGDQLLCVYAIDIPGSSGNVELGCRSVTIAPTPLCTVSDLTLSFYRDGRFPKGVLESPIIAAWHADGGESCTYELQRDWVDGWETVYVGQKVEWRGHFPTIGPVAYFRVRAIDERGVPSEWAEHVDLIWLDNDSSDRFTYIGPFNARSHPRYVQGAAHETDKVGALAHVEVNPGLRTTYGLVGAQCPTCGWIDVYIDGTLVLSRRPHAAVRKERSVLATFEVEAGPHTILFVNAGNRRERDMTIDGIVGLGQL